MEDLIILFSILLILLIFLVIVTVVGHLIWISIAWIIRNLTGNDKKKNEANASSTVKYEQCEICGAPNKPEDLKCYRCGTVRESAQRKELKKELNSAWAQTYRLHKQGKIDDETYQKMKAALESERDIVSGITPQPKEETKPVIQTEAWKNQEQKQPQITPTFKQEEKLDDVVESVEPISVHQHTWAQTETDNHEKEKTVETEIPKTYPKPPQHYPQQPQQPSRSWSEIVEAFMQESNIRWGEIVGGLLIIGCSTALVLSLWNQISQIPILKFFIFTSVTAAFFGIGLYTEHRWKLPTTSRGILTIATLLVPLNFLAIAAVSSGQTSNLLLLVSEIFSPALFFIFVYLSGKTLTPRWAQLFAVGVLGSSVGQILIHHFVDTEMNQLKTILIGLPTTSFFVLSLTLMLRKLKDDDEITEENSNAIFITLGAVIFSAILPLGLLLQKSSSAADALMWIAPLICACAVLILATGVLLWRKIKDKDLAYSRLTGTIIALCSTFILLLCLLISFPNPTSVLLSALINFLVFTAIAFLFEISLAHALAIFALTLAYSVGMNALVGRMDWQLPRSASLFSVLISPRTGQLFTPLFLFYVFVSDWLRRKAKVASGSAYFVASIVIACIGILLLAPSGFALAGDFYFVSVIYLIFALGLFALAWTRKLSGLTWFASFIFILSLVQGIGYLYEARFAWQTALLIYSTIATLFATLFWNKGNEEKRVIANPLRFAALITSSLVVAGLIQSRPWQPTAMITTKLFWLSVIGFCLLWLIRSRLVFLATQAILTCACLLTVKLILQNTDWYAFNPNAYLHPTALHIYGITIVLLSLVWTTLRLVLKHTVAVTTTSNAQFDEKKPESVTSEESHVETAVFSENFSETDENGQNEEDTNNPSFFNSFVEFLDYQTITFDRLAVLFVLTAFTFLTIYGASAGLTFEFAYKDTATTFHDIAGYPHTFANGFTAWVLWALLIATLFLITKDKSRYIFLGSAMFTLSLLCPLIASNWETQTATATAWRWCAAFMFVILHLALLIPGVENQLTKLFSFVSNNAYNNIDAKFSPYKIPIYLSIATLLLLTIYPLFWMARMHTMQGVVSGFFFSIGEVFSYTLPLVIVGVLLCARAIVKRHDDSALGAGLIFTFAVVTAHLTSIDSVAGTMDRVVSAQVLQLVAISAGLFSILWLSIRKRVSQNEKLLKYLTGFLISLSVTANLYLITPVALQLFILPTRVGRGTLEAGSIRGWLGIVFCFIAIGYFMKAFQFKIRAVVLLFSFLSVAAVFAFTLARWDNNLNWRGYHVLFIGTIVTAWLLWLSKFLAEKFKTDDEDGNSFSCFSSYWNIETAIFSTIAIVLVVIMSLRATTANASEWWSVAPLMLMSVLAVCLFTTTLDRLFFYGSAFLLCLSASLLVFWFAPVRNGISILLDFINANVLCVSLVGIVSVILDLRLRKRFGVDNWRERVLTFHQFAVFGVVATISMFYLLVLLINSNEVKFESNPYLLGVTILTTGAFFFACLWDSKAKEIEQNFYIFGLLAAWMILTRLNLSWWNIVWIGCITVGLYSLITSCLWTQREKLFSIAEKVQIPINKSNEDAGLNWLRPFNFVLVLFASLVGLYVVLTYSILSHRLVSSVIVIVQFVALGLLAKEKDSANWKKIALLIFSFGLALFGCAWLKPNVNATWLNRSVVLMIVMFILLTLFGIWKEKLKENFEDWLKPAQAIAPVWVIVSAVSLLFVLITEVAQQIQFRQVIITPIAIAVVAITLFSAAVACVLFALDAKNDPLSLMDNKRMMYVYVAEGLIALLFMHIRLSMPQLFSGFLEKYWAIFVVALSFLGVGLSELLRRRNLINLATPIERTGIFLPLLPVLGFWIVNSRSFYSVDYSFVLFLIGALYGVLSLMRRSFGFGILAALAGNGGFWYILHRTDDFGLLQHPQLWFIPFAFCGLIATHLNRDNFDEKQMTAIRYISLMMIYVSSTVEIFLNGVAESPWLPLVLMLLSVAGVLSGIMFRIRAFLFLGTAFLLIAMVTMIYYASSNLGWTWLWWVAGIFVGGAIIFTFALFEKKRQEMLRLLDEMKAWER